jgi:hypothetical protein
MKRGTKHSNKPSINTRVLIIKPTLKAIKRLKLKIKSIFKLKIPMIALIKLLNPLIRGWTNYYMISPHSMRAFSRLSSYIYTLWKT